MTETLLIQSVPPGAQTKINGKYSRNTPLDLPDLPLGNIWSIFQFVVIFRHNRTLQSYCWRDETDICGTGTFESLEDKFPITCYNNSRIPDRYNESGHGPSSQSYHYYSIRHWTYREWFSFQKVIFKSMYRRKGIA